MAERSGWKRCRLNDGRGDWKEIGVGAKSKRDGAELGCEGEPSDSAVRQKEMAASGGVGCRRDAVRSCSTILVE